MGRDSKLNIKSLCFNSFRENCYVLWDGTGACVIVDPGCDGDAEVDRLKDFIASRGLRPMAIWLTHGHFDHIFGVAALSGEYSLPVMMAPEDKVILERGGELAESVGLNRPDVSFGTVDIIDGQELRPFDGAQGPQTRLVSLSNQRPFDVAQGPVFRVITTPGHTPGSVCFYCEAGKVLLSGDTLFAGAIGRTDVFGGDYDKEIVSLMDKLMELPGEVEVLPGHGPSTTIAYERTNNPFLQPWGDPIEDGMI